MTQIELTVFISRKTSYYTLMFPIFDQTHCLNLGSTVPFYYPTKLIILCIIPIYIPEHHPRSFNWHTHVQSPPHTEPSTFIFFMLPQLLLSTYRIPCLCQRQCFWIILLLKLFDLLIKGECLTLICHIPLYRRGPYPRKIEQRDVVSRCTDSPGVKSVTVFLFPSLRTRKGNSHTDPLICKV